MKRLIGKTALVSGCAGGIGAATADRLAAEGARLMLADINLEGAERVAASIRAKGGDAVAQFLSLGDETSVKASVDAAMARFGKLDILFNNAADTRQQTMTRDAAIDVMDTDVWDGVFHVNVRGAMLMIKHSLPHLIAAGSSSVINTTSGASLRADLFRAAYACSKAAMNVLTEYVAAQYGKRGVRCNAVSPGLVITENARDNQGHNFAMYEAHHLTPHLGEAEDIAAMVAFLASDESRFITAQIIPVDGGISCHFPHVAETRGGIDAQKPVKS